jgi:hypothetical protein
MTARLEEQVWGKHDWGYWGLENQEFLAMCDYSLQGVASRPAAVGDKLVTRNFGTGTRGFSAPEDRNTAVCLLPGTEIAFSGEVAIESPRFFGQSVKTLKHATAIFRQIDKETPHVHHDALEFPDGQIVLLTALREGQEASVLQLPARPTTLREFEEQRRAAFTG